MANRFSQIVQPTVVNPISVDTFMKVPTAKAAATKAAYRNLNSMDTQYDVASSDEADIQSMVDPVMKGKDNIVDRIYNEGVSDDLIGDIMSLRKAYVGAKKNITLAEKNRSRIQATETAIDKAHLNGAYADRVKERETRNWGGTFQKKEDGTLMVGDNGEVVTTEFEGSIGPGFRNVHDDYVKELAGLQATLADEDYKAEDYHLSWEAISEGSAEKALVLRTTDGKLLMSNKSPGMARLNSLTADYMDPLSARGEYAKYDLYNDPGKLEQYLKATAESVLAGRVSESLVSTGDGTRVITTNMAALAANKKAAAGAAKDDGQRGVAGMTRQLGFERVQETYNEIQQYHGKTTDDLEELLATTKKSMAGPGEPGVAATGSSTLPGGVMLDGDAEVFAEGTPGYMQAAHKAKQIQLALDASPSEKSDAIDARYAEVGDFMKNYTTNNEVAKINGITPDTNNELKSVISELARAAAQLDRDRAEVRKEYYGKNFNSKTTKKILSQHDQKSMDEELAELTMDSQVASYGLYKDYIGTVSKVKTTLDVATGNSSFMKDIRERDFNVKAYMADVAGDISGGDIAVLDMNSRSKLPLLESSTEYNALTTAIANFASGSAGKGGYALDFLGNATGDEGFYSNSKGDYVEGSAYGSVVKVREVDANGVKGKVVGTYLLGPTKSERKDKQYKAREDRIRTLTNMDVGETYSGTFTRKVHGRGGAIVEKTNDIEIRVSSTGQHVYDPAIQDYIWVAAGTKIMYMEDEILEKLPNGGTYLKKVISVTPYTSTNLMNVDIDVDQSDPKRLKNTYDISAREVYGAAKEAEEKARKLEEERKEKEAELSNQQ